MYCRSVPSCSGSASFVFRAEWGGRAVLQSVSLHQRVQRQGLIEERSSVIDANDSFDWAGTLLVQA